jgi:hypothetical protein
MRHTAESGFGFNSVTALTALLAAFALFAATSAHAANRAPAIGGTPKTTATVGTTYWFQPWASDPDGNKFYFTIRNKPSWATFNSTYGILQGKPTQAGIYSNIVIAATDGSLSTALPAFSITVQSTTSSTPTTNSAPKISGTPPTSIAVGASYSFKPTASDPNGDKLTFSITNKPSWATFNTGTGLLAGVPSAAHVGTYSSISIKVSDGKTTVSLPTFSISVTQIAAGSATVSWLPPTTNTNGSSLTNLAGYRVKYGKSSTSLTQTVQISNVGVTRYVINNLGSGTWYFGVVAYTSGGVESSLSKLGIKTIK